MWRSIGQKILSQLHLRESWVIFFVLGNVMLNFPFLKIFNQNIHIAGFPLLYLYFTVGWAISIGVIYLFASSVEHQPPDVQNHDQQEQP